MFKSRKYKKQIEDLKNKLHFIEGNYVLRDDIIRTLDRDAEILKLSDEDNSKTLEYLFLFKDRIWDI